mgnify:CR=1 FL=1
MDKAAELDRFRDYLRFGSDEEGPKGDSSVAAYLYTLQRFLSFLNGRQPDRESVLAWAKQLLDDGNSASSVNRHIAALRSWFRSRGQELKIRGMKAIRKLPRRLEPQEWQKLLATVCEPLYNKDRPEVARVKALKERAILFLYVGGALRLSEGARLKKTDVRDEGYLRVLGKGAREETIPVDDAVLRGVREYLATRHDDNPYLFPGKSPGSHISPNVIGDMIRDMAKRAGLAGVHPHTLRHTAGAILREMGVDARDMQDFMRHRDPSSTALYTQMAKPLLRTRTRGIVTNGLQGALPLPERKEDNADQPEGV